MKSKQDNIDLNSLLNEQSLPFAKTLPNTVYIDHDILSLEKQAIFAKHWQYIGGISQLPKVGDYFTIRLHDKPLIIVNTPTHGIQVFYNICRHRAGPLAKVKCGHLKQLSCQYHGWQYDWQGKLKRTTEFKGVENFHKDDYSLYKCEFRIWQGLIFVCFERPNFDLENLGGEIKNRINPIDFSDWQFYKQVSYEINCNWKVYVDNFLEGYHLPYVHPELNKLLDYKNYQTELSHYYSLQTSPLRGEDHLYKNTNNDYAFYYFIFPNIMLNILPNRLQVNLIEPLSNNSTLVIFDYYYPLPLNQSIAEKDLHYSEAVQQEDIEICTAVQLNLQANIYESGRFSVQQEKGVHHFQRLWQQSIKKMI